ncbi:MAG TPA: response regulator [Gaiellaceae bacterium]|nr:response regulator [Gaiellaceae bacterium]
MKAPVRVLVVDDDPSLRLLCRVNLEHAGFQVAEAATVEEAEAALDDRPDVVLLDVHLGGSESTGVLRRIHEEHIPVAIVTGSVDVAEYRGIADAVLSKPFVPAMLVEVASRLARVGE